MENIKVSKLSKGRPKFVADKVKLVELFKRVADKEITNEERMANCTAVKRQNGLN